MNNIVDVTYAQTPASINTDALGMREMQARATLNGRAQYMLPTASCTSCPL